MGRVWHLCREYSQRILSPIDRTFVLRERLYILQINTSLSKYNFRFIVAFIWISIIFFVDIRLKYKVAKVNTTGFMITNEQKKKKKNTSVK